VAGLVVLGLVLAVAALALAARSARAPRRRTRRAPRAEWLREAPVGHREAERRSLDLLRSCVNEDEWRMFRELGFICVTGRRPGRDGPPRYRYLIYPHLPVVALLPRSLAPVREYCVLFPERDGEPALPTGDDVLAKWMTLRADESRLLAYANVSSPGCQIPLSRIERDIARYRRWTEGDTAVDPDPVPGVRSVA
jgi:hypothetical protein